MIAPWFADTVTIYNKYQDQWKRTVLNNCYFGAVRNEYLTNTTVAENNTLLCRIPENANYLKPSAYAGADGTFTLQLGDVVVSGVVEDVIKDEAGKRVSNLLEKYKGESFKIKTVSINTKNAAPHYRVAG